MKVIKRKCKRTKDDYKSILTFVQERIGNKVVVTRNLTSIEQCDKALHKIINETAGLNIAKDNKFLRERVRQLENDVNKSDDRELKLTDKIIELECEILTLENRSILGIVKDRLFGRCL